MSNANVQHKAKYVEFPQPMVEAPEVGSRYWVIYGNGKVYDLVWHAAEYDRAYLNAGNVYATKAGVDQRAAYNAQEMARLVMPAWFRKLGPDVEFQWAPGKWETVDLSGRDWSQEKPENYRAKVRDVVVTVNGKEYRWPATVEEGEPIGYRYTAMSEAGIVCEARSCRHGNRTHHARAGAEAQNTAIIALLSGAESQLAATRAAAGVVA